MKFTTVLLVVLVVSCAVPLVSAQAVTLSAQALTGTWQATVKVNGLDIPFRIEFAAAIPLPKPPSSMATSDSSPPAESATAARSKSIGNTLPRPSMRH